MLCNQLTSMHPPTYRIWLSKFSVRKLTIMHSTMSCSRYSTRLFFIKHYYGVTIILVIIIGRLIQLCVHEIIICRRNIHQSLIRPIWVIWNSSSAPRAKFLSCTMEKSFIKRISCGTNPQNFRLRRRKIHARSSKPVPCKVQILQHRVAMCCKVQIVVCAP